MTRQPANDAPVAGAPLKWVAIAAALLLVSPGLAAAQGVPRAQPAGVAVAAPTPIAYEISTERDLTLNGIAFEDVTGRDSAVGDVNGDGTPDLIIGARQADPSGRTDAGRVYVYFGPLAPGVVEISHGAHIVVNGVNPGDEAGIGVAVGDINNDGGPDLIVGARWVDPGGRTDAGAVYVMFGPLAAGVYELSRDADIVVNGIAPGDELGVGVAGGDLNNDGRADLIVGARHADPPGKIDAGQTYVLFGPIAAGVIELAAAPKLTISGDEPDDKSGYGLETGDVNGDRIPDLVLGAWAADANGKANAGKAYVLFGPMSEGAVDLAIRANVTINGNAVEDHLGVDAALADLNRDGIADLMLGATEADPLGRDRAGQAYIVYGPLGAGTYEVAAVAQVVYYGIAPADYFGIGLAGGDLNRDMLPDMVFSAFRADPGGRMNAGQVYVVFGKCGSRLPTIVGTPGDDVLVGTPGDDVLVGLEGNDQISGGEGNDTICGGPGNDVIAGGPGSDALIGGAGNDFLIGGDGDDLIVCGPGTDVADGAAGTDRAGADCERQTNIELPLTAPALRQLGP